MAEVTSAALADEALERLRRRHDGEMYGCVACYRGEPCAERQLVVQYDRLLAAESGKLDEAEQLLADLQRLEAAVGTFLQAEFPAGTDDPADAAADRLRHAARIPRDYHNGADDQA